MSWKIHNSNGMQCSGGKLKYLGLIFEPFSSSLVSDGDEESTQRSDWYWIYYSYCCSHSQIPRNGALLTW